MANNTSPAWTQEEIDRLTQELETLKSLKRIKGWSGKQMREMIAQKIDRSPQAISIKANQLGLSFGDRADAWSEQEIEFATEQARKFAAEGMQLKEISVKLSHSLGRTHDRIASKINRLGILPQPRCHISWGEEEREYALRIVGDRPFPLVYKALNEWRKKRGLRSRTEHSVRGFFAKQGISVLICTSKMYTAQQIADGLRCSRARIENWLRTEPKRKLLAPTEISTKIYIPTKNLRQFLIKYPLAIEGLQPDMLWLIELLTDESVDVR